MLETIERTGEKLTDTRRQGFDLKFKLTDAVKSALTVFFHRLLYYSRISHKSSWSTGFLLFETHPFSAGLFLGHSGGFIFFLWSGILKINMNISKLAGVFSKLLLTGKSFFSGLTTLTVSLKDTVIGFFRRTSAGSGRFALTPGKKHLMLAGLGGLFVILLAFSVVFLFSEKRQDRTRSETAAGPVIPMDELFLPDEPDFVPDYLPEREPRRFWSLEEIRPFWKSPGNEELWRREIKSAVDNLMEGVQ